MQCGRSPDKSSAQRAKTSTTQTNQSTSSSPTPYWNVGTAQHSWLDSCRQALDRSFATYLDHVSSRRRALDDFWAQGRLKAEKNCEKGSKYKLGPASTSPHFAGDLKGARLHDMASKSSQELPKRDQGTFKTVMVRIQAIVG
eukprot:1389030-Amorphochlora_amoeboformis.AAC.2